MQFVGGQEHQLQQTGPSAYESINEENSVQYQSPEDSQYGGNLQNLNRISDVSGLIDGYEAQQLQSDPDQFGESGGHVYNTAILQSMNQSQTHSQNQDMYYS